MTSVVVSLTEADLDERLAAAYRRGMIAGVRGLQPTGRDDSDVEAVMRAVFPEPQPRRRHLRLVWSAPVGAR